MESDLRQLTRDEYPEGLREIPQVPTHLWLRGNLPPAGHKVLTVVGSRDLSPYGQEVIDYLIGGLSGYPISIVSGLALGADAAAHRTALSAGLHTMAFPGSGIAESAIAPRTNAGLAQKILEQGGALISEYAPTSTPQPWMFPQRNRLMVGIAQAVLVIEAGERSGTLITARLTGEYNRDLLCVPHRIGDPHGYGSSLFLRLGAGLVTEPAHILEALHIPEQEETSSSEDGSQQLSPNEELLLSLLTAPTSREDLVTRSKLPQGEALTALVMLEPVSYTHLTLPTNREV